MSLLEELSSAAPRPAAAAGGAVVRLSDGPRAGVGVVIGSGHGVLTSAHNLRGEEATVTFARRPIGPWATVKGVDPRRRPGRLGRGHGGRGPPVALARKRCRPTGLRSERPCSPWPCRPAGVESGPPSWSCPAPGRRFRGPRGQVDHRWHRAHRAAWGGGRQAARWSTRTGNSSASIPTDRVKGSTWPCRPQWPCDRGSTPWPKVRRRRAAGWAWPSRPGCGEAPPQRSRPRALGTACWCERSSTGVRPRRPGCVQATSSWPQAVVRSIRSTSPPGRGGRGGGGRHDHVDRRTRRGGDRGDRALRERGAEGPGLRSRTPSRSAGSRHQAAAQARRVVLRWASALGICGFGPKRPQHLFNECSVKKCLAARARPDGRPELSISARRPSSNTTHRVAVDSLGRRGPVRAAPKWCSGASEALT